MPSVEGAGARHAALQMLDAVLRRGQTLDGALSVARNLSPPDRALALAIAGETLRRLPELVEERWRAAWGEGAVTAARRQIAKRPPLDLSFADDAEAQAYAAQHSGVSLAPRHVRVESASVADLPGFGEGRWWVQDLAAS